MPAKSKAQQRLFGMVDAMKKGDLKNAPPIVRRVAAHVTRQQARDFSSTKRKGLPSHVGKRGR